MTSGGTDLIARGPGWELIAGTNGPQPVSIKRHDASVTELSSLARCHRELEILRAIEGPFTPRALDLTTTNARPALVLQDLSGFHSLADLTHALGPWKLERFLPIAAKIATALGEIHQQDVIHKAMRPEHVLVRGDEILLVGFEQASRMAEAVNESALQDLPAVLYAAPEQTGRMNRPVDYRSDLYSLGVVLYEMLTGVLPFAKRDVVGTIHAHIAITPEPLRSLRPEVPAALEAAVAKLLAKTPDERYQNAFAVAEDLGRIREAFERGEELPIAELGQSDHFAHFAFTQRLYGRQADAKKLTCAFERAARGGREVMFLSGYAGVGKTTLVNETQRPLAERGGYFVSGKFDQHERITPLSAVRRAFADLLQRLADGPEALRDQIASKLATRLGASIVVLLDVIPELSLLVERPKVTVELGAAEADDRFRLAFCRLVAALASKHHPLVLFLDDLQWVDAVTLGLIEDLATADEISYFLVIGAYRDNEVDVGHPLMTTLRRLEQAGAPIARMTLAPLERADVEALITDSFSSDQNFAAPLAARVHTQTGGNPFFIRRLLRALYDERILRFDFRSASWTCDVAAVARFDDSPNVVELMVRELRRLDEEVVDVLGLAACIGETFDLATLAGLAKLQPHVVEDRLWSALRARMLELSSGHEWTELGASGHSLVDEHAEALVYRFRHDRVQQAAYMLVEPERLPAIHLALCRLLRARRGPRERGFERAGHCIRALSAVEDPEEKHETLRLLLSSASRAIAVNAANAAEEYCRATLGVLDPTISRDAELTLQAQKLLGESQVLVGDFDGARRSFEQALASQLPKLERVAILALMMEMWVSQGRLRLALSTLVQILRVFGIDLDESNVAEAASRASQEIIRARRGRSAREIVEAPETDDPEVVALLDVLARASDTTYMNGRDWVVAVSAIAVTTVLERGSSIAASMTFSIYAVADAEPHTAEGFARRAEYGRIGMELAERYGAASWIARANVSNVHHFAHPFREAIAGYERAAAIGWDSSALTWAAYAEVRALFCMLVAGVPLARIDRERNDRAARIRRANRTVSVVCCDALELFVRSLRDISAQPWCLGGSTQAARALEARLETSGPWAACKAHALQQLLAVVYERWSEADAAARAIDPIIHGLDGMTHEHWFHVLDVIRLVNDRDPTNEAARTRATARAKQAKRFFEARIGMNSDYLAGYRIVRAALADLGRDGHRAIEELNRAIETARDRGQLPMLAIASEEAHRVAKRGGWESLAGFYLSEAHAAYVAWGATAKARELAARLPTRTTMSEGISVADVESLLKSVRAISGELRTTQLLQRLVHILLENAGAQRGLIVLERDGTPLVEAMGKVLGPGIEVVLPAVPLDEKDVAFGLVRRVLRTGETIAIDDLEAQTSFSFPSSVRRPRSTLTMPIESRGQCIGALHLESWEATHAFHADARRTLWLLMSQAVTALDNARLYGNLEREIEERARTEAALREERDYSRRVFESLPLLACGVEADGTIAFVNPSVERATGLDKGQLVGRCFWRTLHSRPRERKALREQLRRDGQVRARETTLDTSGQDRVISWTCVPGGVHRSQVLCFGADVTEERQHQQDRAVLEEQLRRSQKLETLGTLASGIAHDFNNILVPITAYAEMLETQVEEGSVAHEYVTEIGGAAARAADLVRRILAASRKTEQARRPVLIQEVAAEVCRLLESSLGARIEVRTKIDGGCPPIASNPSQIHQALLNLGTNAAHAMQPDGGVLEVSVTRATFPASSARAGEPSVRITVSDTGRGMDEATRTRIFDPFFTTKPVGQGTGLGLWIVHSIVESAGGSIDVASELGKGTTFSIDFPVSEQGETDSESAVPRPTRGRERVLVVDDEAAIVRTLDRALTHLGYRVSAFTSPREALEALQHAPHEVDAVLTDLTMPEFDGLALAERVHALRADLPIILTSGLVPDETPSNLAERGILAIIDKPLSLARIGAVLREVLDRAR